MVAETKFFGTVDIEEDKIIEFPMGIIGFEDYKKFALIYDSEREERSKISWLQSLDEPVLALPVINPIDIMDEYSQSNAEDMEVSTDMVYSQVVGLASMLGVNTAYADDVATDCFGKYNYIIDIDKKNIILKKELNFSEEDDGKDFNDLNSFRNYIKNILRDRNVDSIFLKSFIDSMKKSLNNLLSKEPDVKEKKINFFISSDEIIDKNTKIQEIFYNFYINILMIFTQDNTLNSSYDQIQKDKQEDIIKRIFKLRGVEEKKTEMNPDENYFCFMFRKSFKYKVYFENFIKNFESLEIFKIPLLFGQEFIYIKIKDSNNDLSNRISLFKIIDSLYIPPSSQTIKITLNNIYYDYQDRLKKYFANFFTQERLNKMEQNQLINLDKKILTKYIYLLNNVYEKDDLDYFFPSIKIQETASIISINAKDVINSFRL